MAPQADPGLSSIQNGLCRSLISQNFLPKGDKNRRFRRTLRNKRFFGASDTTADHRARSSWLRKLARTIESRGAGRTRQRRHAARQRAGLLRHLTATSRQAPDVRFGGQTEKTYARSEPYRS